MRRARISDWTKTPPPPPSEASGYHCRRSNPVRPTPSLCSDINFGRHNDLFYGPINCHLANTLSNGCTSNGKGVRSRKITKPSVDMHLSRICISNFRNFSELDVELSGNVVVVGENRVGKSNLLYALRLIFDASIPDSSRQLSLSDFWDSLGKPDSTDVIQISVELKEFEDDLDVLAVLTDYRLDADPSTVRLTYEFRPQAGLTGEPSSDSDYEFVCYGGENESKRFGHELRRRIALDVLPA